MDLVALDERISAGTVLAPDQKPEAMLRLLTCGSMVRTELASTNCTFCWLATLLTVVVRNGCRFEMLKVAGVLSLVMAKGGKDTGAK